MEKTSVRISSRFHCALIAVAAVIQGCAFAPEQSENLPLASDASRLHGWKNCVFACDKSFFAAYSKFVFLRVDDRMEAEAASVVLNPGLHWVEAHYAWGGGMAALGVGNFRGYGLELEAVLGHSYTIAEVPGGCIVPATKTWVRFTTLTIEDRFGNAPPSVRPVKAMEFCSPSANRGTCKTDSDCGKNTCTPFGGASGYGLCGDLR